MIGCRFAAFVAALPVVLGLTPAVPGQGYTIWNLPSVSVVDGAGDLNGDGFADFVATGGNVAIAFSGAGGAPLHTFAYPFTVFSAARAGDIDGDGVDDLVIGTAGKVDVMSGASGAALYSFNTAAGTVAGAGDVDADGTPDVVAAVPLAVKVFSGATGAVLHALTGEPGLGLAGVAGAGDADGDGHDDIFVGGGVPRTYSGATGAILQEFIGGGLGTFPTSVANVGDLNGDGVPDLAAGAAFPSFSNANGYALVFSGASGTVLYLLHEPGIPPGTGTGGLGNGFGAFVAAAGDLDGDGVPDVAVGPGGYGTKVWIFSGASGGVLFKSSLGYGSFVGIGDVDADGIPDLGHYGGLVLSVVGIPAGTSAYGPGCAGTGGFVPKMSTFGGAPSPGNASFGFSFSKGLGGGLALLFLASAPDPGTNLGGCFKLLSGTIIPVSPVTLAGTLGVGGAGYRLHGVPVPAIPSLAGLTLFFHWAALDPGSPNGLFTTPSALAVTIP